MDEESKLFMRKLSKLESVWEKLNKSSNFTRISELDKLRNKSRYMSDCVKNEGSLNAGGKFEWVDSVLIKCLQDGSWLLIDNVNLCSAAVLDRLNGLLEPNGVLTISERGVDANGHMIEVKPHKDFRLFLTMDPKNGEISRAMRNRGVEIYMLNEKEANYINQYDIKSLIESNGLKSTRYINCLIQIHDFISELILGDKPNVNELLQAAALISQQLNYGTKELEAFYSTVVEIYCKTRSAVEFSCNNISGIIKNEIENIMDEFLRLNTKGPFEMYNKSVTLSTQNIQFSVDLEKVKQHSAMLENILRLDTVQKHENILINLFQNCYSITSLEDLPIRHLYLGKTLQRLNEPDFCKLNDDLHLIILNQLGKFTDDLPIDLRWTPDILLSMKNITESNILNFTLYTACKYFQENIETERNNKNARSLKEVTLLTYMHEVKTKKFEDKFNNPVVASFLELIKEYDSRLKTAILGVKELTDHDVINLYYLFMWRLVFFRCTLQGINKKTSAERHKILTNLTVHYKWFLKNSVMRVFKIFNLQISDKLEETIATLDNKLEKEFSFMHKVGKNFQKFSDKPPPCINEHQLESIALYNDIAIFYNICDKRNNVVRISNNLMENPELHNLLIQLQSKLDFEFTDISNEIITLQSLHKSNMENFVQDNDASNFKAQISPLFATFILRKLQSFISVKFEGINFLGNNALIPIELQGLLLRFSKSRDPRTLHELSTSYFTYVMNSACVRPGRYLRGSEGEVEDIVLHGSNPLMSYHLTSLLVSTSNRDNLPMTTLGNFKRMEGRHLWCNMLLWCDVKQFSDDEHDYLNCQKLYVVNDFKTFIRQFSKSLRIPSGEAMTDTDLTDTCIKKLLNLKEVSSLRETKENVLQFTTLLQTCAENIARLSEAISFDEKLLFTSDIYMRLSYIKFLCNSKLPLIDPLAKQSLKRSYCTEAIEIFSDMKTAYVLQNDVFSGSEETLHAYVPHITKMVEDLKKEDEALGKYVAVRPRDVMYEAVVKVVHHGYNTVLSFDNVNKTLTNLNDQINILTQAAEAKAVVDLTECIVILNQCDSTVATYENLIQEWSAYRSGYPDIIEPLLSNVTQFLYGIVMKLSLLRKLVKECEISKFDINLKNDMLNLVKVPSLDANQTSYGEMINFFTSQKMQNFINNLLHNDEFPNIKKVENFRLLKCGIQESFNHCIADSKSAECVNEQLIQEFLSLVQRFVNAWSKQQELKEVQQREAENLYKTKTKCDDLPEEKQIEKELKELFPNYHDIDFADFQKTSEMGDDDINISTSEGNLSGIITEEDLEFVVDLHTTLLKNYTTAEWLSPKRNKALSPNFVQPLMEKFKLFRQILEKTIDGLDYTMDARLAGSFIVLSSVHQRYGDVSELCDVSISKNKSFDFYKDANVEEVKSALPILEELRSRISELLVEWPEQPTLKMILTVIDRLYSFDITSPISRFCTGFEILLNKLHEWEEVAHSGVSLSQYSQNVIQQIITWRKLELNMWKNLDNITYERLNKARQKWWVYIFEITQQFVAEKRFSADELIESLQHFVTKSNLAEFEARMELLFTFHCHAVFLDRTQESELYINILWNVYSYFKQFSTTIRNKIKDLQAPIDKKMKDYIKIVKWKDTSYWSAKEMVDKTHKTLHKYVRELENVLRQPVAPFLKDTSNISTVDNVGIWDRPKRQSPKKYHYTLDADSYILKSVGKKLFSTSFTFDEGLLSRTDSYLQKSRKLCKETILATKYPSLMRSLDSFVREIIASSSSLSKMEVDTTLPKNKQISQAKGILQRKHRALADLFKALSKIGLSFRMGIIDSKLIAPSSDFVLQPIDLNANFSHLSHGPKDEKILTIWDSCEMYYVRSLNRRDVLNTALEVPAKDLGIQNIERCKGFSAHLLALTQQLKSELIESTRIFYYLRIYFKKITEFCGNKQFLPANRLERIRELLINVSIVLEQYKIVFNTIPEGKSKSHDLTTIDIPSWVTGEGCEMNPFKDDLFVMKLIKYVNDTLNISSKLVSYLEQCRGVLPCVEFTIKYFEYVPIDDIEVIMEDLNSIHKNINEIHKMIGNIPLGESLQWLSKEFCTVKEDLQYCESEYTTDDTGNFKAQVEKFIEKNLLVIQSMYKRYITATPEEAVTTDPTDEEKETQLEDNHLKTLVIENLTQDFSALEMRNILRLLHKIVDVLFSGPPSSGHRDIVLQAMPLFEQTILLYQYFITQQVSAYRLTCKMNSILLSIFTELVSKGFCIPPEFSDEMDSEGISKPSDGLGLGDGEGQKDVSDKIESEDQLEEAHPAGQEKEAEEDKECKEEDKGIEMSEDFDSKLQDKEKRDDDDDDSNSDSDAHEQMGETGKGADELDQEIWGSDKEDNENEDDPESKEEKGNTGEKQSEEQLGAKDEDPAKTSEHDDRNASDEKEQKTKEINEMEEPELDDEQTDPYHGKQAELPEPEAMDLPDDLQLDEGQENDNETQEENPFDIDTMKEQNIPQDVEEDGGEKAQEEPQNDEAKDYSSDEEEITKKPNDLDEEMLKDSSENEATEDQNKTQNEAEKDDDDQKDTNETDESAFDQTQSKEDNVEAMEVNESAIADKTEASSADIQRSSEPMDELSQEDQPDKEGVGQSQMEESSSGHNTQMNAPQEIQIGKRDREDENKSQRPGESDSTRSLGDTSEPVKKKLKTVDAKNTDDIQRNDREQDDNAEMYQHIKDASEDAMTQVLDAATKEQAEAQEKDVPNVDEEEVDKPTETSEELPPEDENEDIQVQDGASQQAEIAEKKTEMNKKRQHPEGDILEEVPEIDVEGDIIKTSTVQRSTESSHHTAFSNLSESSATRLTVDEINALRVDVEKQLSVWNEPPTELEAEQTWQKISSVTSSLAQDLSEQLRLVLEPTQASRLKGDFRTGRRINMRKVIPYIASQFRKDKIWLRRTKPSKREYQIVLAIDDSSSMADNKSKELAFESVALISKALTLLESGQLAVLSFGESTEILHKLTDTFTDKSGVKLLQKFKFDQNKTGIAKLVDFTTEMFNQSQAQSAALIAKLLVIVSDGRGVFSEGESYVRQAVRRAKLSNIFMVFVIIDNPENKNSILDIRMPVFKDGKLFGIESYMDAFPFSFYIILRDINSLPSVLSDALRQWFEIVSNLDKQ